MSIANCQLPIADWGSSAEAGIANCPLPIGSCVRGEALPIADWGRGSVLARNWRESQGSRGRSPSRARILARFIVGPWGRARRFNNNTTRERN